MSKRKFDDVPIDNIMKFYRNPKTGRVFFKNESYEGKKFSYIIENCTDKKLWKEWEKYNGQYKALINYRNYHFNKKLKKTEKLKNKVYIAKNNKGYYINPDKFDEKENVTCLECDEKLFFRKSYLKHKFKEACGKTNNFDEFNKICNDCHKTLVFVKSHWFHLLTTSCSNRGESVEHATAKDKLSNFNDIQLNIRCSYKNCCNWLKISEKNVTTQKEYKLDKYYIDLAVLKDNKLIYLIEVKHTHKVQPEKEEFLNKYCKEKKISWFEFCAESINKDKNINIRLKDINDNCSCDICSHLNNNIKIPYLQMNFKNMITVLEIFKRIYKSKDIPEYDSDDGNIPSDESIFIPLGLRSIYSNIYCNEFQKYFRKRVNGILPNIELYVIDDKDFENYKQMCRMLFYKAPDLYFEDLYERREFIECDHSESHLDEFNLNNAFCRGLNGCEYHEDEKYFKVYKNSFDKIPSSISFLKNDLPYNVPGKLIKKHYMMYWGENSYINNIIIRYLYLDYCDTQKDVNNYIEILYDIF